MKGIGKGKKDLIAFFVNDKMVTEMINLIIVQGNFLYSRLFFSFLVDFNSNASKILWRIRCIVVITPQSYCVALIQL